MVHILMLGSTGLTGLEFIQAALQANHQVTLFVQSPGRLPGNIGSNPNVKVAVYESLGDFFSLERVLGCGATVFVSFAGPEETSKGTPVSDAIKYAFPILAEYRYERVLIFGTCAYTAPEDKGGLKWKASNRLTKMTDGGAYKDFSTLGNWISTQPSDLVKWTLFRVHHLIDGSAKPVTATYTGSGKDKTNLTRKSMVNWVLEEMVKGEWIGKAPVICNS